MKTEWKLILLSVLAIAAVALCALPFFARDEKTIYIYTKQPVPSKEEQIFANELNKLGYKIKLNPQNFPSQKIIGFWFRSPEFAAKIATQSQAKYNFLYSDEYYPFDWYKMKKYPIVLTPYQDLYEHYMRANLKSALFQFETNASSAASRLHELLIWLKENKVN